MSGFDITKVLGAGTSDMDRAVLGQPFIQIIQKGSPEFDETHPDYREKKIEGCRPGNILFVPERKILVQPISVIPLSIVQLYTEWKPRSAGGGFVANRPLSIVSERGYRRGAPNTPDQYKEWFGNNELKMTIYSVVMFLLGDTWKRGIVSFSATGLKPARIWQRQILGLRYPAMPDAEPPIFAAKWNFASVPESNDKGGWYGWDIKFDKLLDFTADQPLLEDASARWAAEVATAPKAIEGSAAKPEELEY